jgi:hypothetical protein
MADHISEGNPNHPGKEPEYPQALKPKRPAELISTKDLKLRRANRWIREFTPKIDAPLQSKFENLVSEGFDYQGPFTEEVLFRFDRDRQYIPVVSETAPSIEQTHSSLSVGYRARLTYEKSGWIFKNEGKEAAQVEGANGQTLIIEYDDEYECDQDVQVMTVGQVRFFIIHDQTNPGTIHLFVQA